MDNDSAFSVLIRVIFYLSRLTVFHQHHPIMLVESNGGKYTKINADSLLLSIGQKSNQASSAGCYKYGIMTGIITPDYFRFTFLDLFYLSYACITALSRIGHGQPVAKRILRPPLLHPAFPDRRDLEINNCAHTYSSRGSQRYYILGTTNFHQRIFLTP